MRHSNSLFKIRMPQSSLTEDFTCRESKLCPHFFRGIAQYNWRNFRRLEGQLLFPHSGLKWSVNLKKIQTFRRNILAVSSGLKSVWNSKNTDVSEVNVELVFWAYWPSDVSEGNTSIYWAATQCIQDWKNSQYFEEPYYLNLRTWMKRILEEFRRVGGHTSPIYWATGLLQFRKQYCLNLQGVTPFHPQSQIECFQILGRDWALQRRWLTSPTTAKRRRPLSRWRSCCGSAAASPPCCSGCFGSGNGSSSRRSSPSPGRCVSAAQGSPAAKHKSHYFNISSFRSLTILTTKRNRVPNV